MMQVIDVGALRSKTLAEFLGSSPKNFAVLPDYAAMESFKGSGETNVRKSLELLSRHIEQVVLLKPTGVISLLRPRSKGLVNRLIDDGHTSAFCGYCCELFLTPSGRGEISYDIAKKQERANRHFERLTTNAEEIRKGITMLEASYTKEEMKILRSEAQITTAIANRIVHDVMINAQSMYVDLGFDKMPALEDAIYGFPFRYALTGYSEALWWLKAGGHRTVAGPKLRNDFTDAVYAAYATFFDGV